MVRPLNFLYFACVMQREHSAHAPSLTCLRGRFATAWPTVTVAGLRAQYYIAGGSAQYPCGGEAVAGNGLVFGFPHVLACNGLVLVPHVTSHVGAWAHMSTAYTGGTVIVCNCHHLCGSLCVTVSCCGAQTRPAPPHLVGSCLGRSTCWLARATCGTSWPW
jgi:hypothetical protein